MPDPIYAVGDVHGHLEKLIALHGWIARDAARLGISDPCIVHVGDLVDRGPDSRGVIDYMIRGAQAHRPWITLKGNHDRMFEWFLERPPRHDPHLLIGHHWLHERLGGMETLRSYGIGVPAQARLVHVAAEARQKVPEAHRRYLQSLALWHVAGGVIFVHAGIRPGVPLGDQDEEDLLWIRDAFHADTRDHGMLVVHGHTPVPRITHYGNRINIDTGAAYGDALSAIVIDGDEILEIGEDGRREICRSGGGAVT